MGARQQFELVLVKPSHYDDDGYVIQWFRSAVPSNSLAVVRGLVDDCKARRVLGEDVDIVVTSIDEDNTRVRVKRIARKLRGRQGLVVLVGVQSNQFPRAMDIARPLRTAGVQVCMGGFHVSGCLSMLGGVTPELQEAMDLGISLFAGEAEERRMDLILRDAYQGTMKPLYNYLADLPSLEGAPYPMLPASTIRGTIGKNRPASTRGADARSSAPSAPSSTCRGGNRGGGRRMRSSRLCGGIWRRASAGFSSPTITSRGTRIGKRCLTG